MRKSIASAAIAVTAVLALEYVALSTSIGPVARAQSSLNCPVEFERLQSELREADDADSTGFNNHYWAVVVNRQGTVCAVAYSGRDRDSQWLLSRQIAAAKAFTANGLSLDDASISTGQLYPWVQPGAPENPLFGLADANPVNPDGAYKGNYNEFGTRNDPMVGQRVGGTITFGGGLALYSRREPVGGAGLSGDTACADHSTAWRLREYLRLAPSVTGADARQREVSQSPDGAVLVARCTMLQNKLYVGIIDASGYGVVGKRGDFDPLIPDDVFYRVQAILAGRVYTTGPYQRRRPEFPLRAFIKCAACGRGVTASWSKGRSARYAYYHCLPPCRAVNITKVKLEGLFVDELERFQPTPGYMRLLKESVLRVWHNRKDSVKNEVVNAEHRAKAIQQKLDRLDDAFIYKESIDLGTYERQRDRLREELTLIEIDRHWSKVEEFDVEGVLNFAERVLPRASDLWIQSSLEQRQRLQRLFFPEGVAFSGKAFDRTVVTSALFEYLRPPDASDENVVAQICPRWNPLISWMRQIEDFQRAA